MSHKKPRVACSRNNTIPTLTTYFAHLEQKKTKEPHSITHIHNLKCLIYVHTHNNLYDMGSQPKSNTHIVQMHRLD